MKNDAEFEEELTCRFKIDMRNLMNFVPSAKMSPLTKVSTVWAKKGSEEICLIELKILKDSEEELTCAFKNYMSNLENFSQAEKQRFHLRK